MKARAIALGLLVASAAGCSPSHAATAGAVVRTLRRGVCTACRYVQPYCDADAAATAQESAETGAPLPGSGGEVSE